MSTTSPLPLQRTQPRAPGLRRAIPRRLPRPRGRTRLPGATRHHLHLPMTVVVAGLLAGLLTATIEMERRFNPATRDRAIRLVRRATVGGVGGAVGLSAIFSGAAILTFAGKPVASVHQTPSPPPVPAAAAPVQAPPPTPIVVVQVVHHRVVGSTAGGNSGAVPRPPGQPPGSLGGSPAAGAPAGQPAPPPPPPPVCHSTPTVPC
jgi:hypothetical protein